MKLFRRVLRIAIDATPIFRPRAGVGYAILRVLENLVAIDRENEYHLYRHDGGRSPWPESLIAPNVRRFSVAKIGMPWQIRWRRADLVHGMNYRLPGRGRRGSLVTIYDLALERFPDLVSVRRRLRLRWAHARTRRTVHRASLCIVPSMHTASDLIQVYDVSAERIRKVPCGVEEKFRPEHDPEVLRAVRVRYGLGDRPYLLFVGTLDLRKDPQIIVRALARIPEPRPLLVLTGGDGSASGEVRQAIEETGLGNSVILAGYIPESDLPGLYAGAITFLFPSRYEGFGLPPLEAMACGTPVIAATGSSLDETLGSAALRFTPGDVEGLAAVLRWVLSDSALREDLAHRGLVHAKGYTWRAAAERTLEIYQEVAASAVRGAPGRGSGFCARGAGRGAPEPSSAKASHLP